MGKRTRRGRNAEVREDGIEGDGGRLRLMCALVAEVSGPLLPFVEFVWFG